MTVVGAREHNLKNLTVRFPLGRLVSVSGVSGSGKSTLVRDILHNAYARRVKGAVSVDVGLHDRIEGWSSYPTFCSSIRRRSAGRRAQIR